MFISFLAFYVVWPCAINLFQLYLLDIATPIICIDDDLCLATVTVAANVVTYSTPNETLHTNLNF
jgi:hypothetical protein